MPGGLPGVGGMGGFGIDEYIVERRSKLSHIFGHVNMVNSLCYGRCSVKKLRPLSHSSRGNLQDRFKIFLTSVQGS